MPTRTLVMTGDGSPTLFVPSLNEHFHSTFGAFTESMHVFIETGLKHLLPSKSEINVFEMGFGTGLNAWLTALEAEKSRSRIRYTAVESDPVEPELIDKLHYTESTGKFNEALLKKLHEVAWNESIQLTPDFEFRKIHTNFLELEIRNWRFDLVYY